MSEARDILHDALKNLDSKVERIEQVLERRLNNAGPDQHDLFAGNEAHLSQEDRDMNSDGHGDSESDIDPAAVARKLDKAIARVEQLLREE